MNTNHAIHTTRRARGRTASAVLVGIFALSLVACGDDDGRTAAAPAAPSAEESSETTHATDRPDDGDEATGDISEFCEAHEVVESTVMAGDEAGLEAAFGAFVASAPEELSGVVATLVELVSTGQDESPEFQIAYDELLAEMHEPCGRGLLEVTAIDYLFEGVPETVPAGPTTLRLDNQGTEFHHMVVYRVDDDVTAPLGELVALTHEPGGPLTPLGAAEALPGSSASTFLGLEPGRYVAVCLVPVGTTPDKLAAVQTGEHGGAPHFEHGMVTEFVVQ